VLWEWLAHRGVAGAHAPCRAANDGARLSIGAAFACSGCGRADIARGAGHGSRCSRLDSRDVHREPALGAPRIDGELQKSGIVVSQSSAATWCQSSRICPRLGSRHRQRPALLASNLLPGLCARRDDSRGDAYSGSANGAAIAVAERLHGTRDRLDPTQVARSRYRGERGGPSPRADGLHRVLPALAHTSRPEAAGTTRK